VDGRHLSCLSEHYLAEAYSRVVLCPVREVLTPARRRRGRTRRTSHFGHL